MFLAPPLMIIMEIQKTIEDGHMERSVPGLEEVRKLIEEKDRVLQLFGMEILSMKEGESVVRMKVGEEHLMAAGYCHGGAIFSLADVAFALACNSHGTLSLALDMSISFLRSVKPGAVLTASCRERYLGKSTGCYDIEVSNEGGELVSFLKATAFRKNVPVPTDGVPRKSGDPGSRSSAGYHAK
jgi:acyl-CoA thioesterase